MPYLCIMWSGDCKPTMYLFLIQYMGCVKITPLATCLQCGYASKSCSDTWEIWQHRGCYKLVIRAFPDLGAPCLIKSLTLLSIQNVLSLIGLYILESRILFTPQSLRRSGEASWRRVWLFSPQISQQKIRITRVSWNRSDGFVTRTLFLVPPDI